MTKLSNPSILTDGYATGFDIDVWKSKIVKKLTVNADHYQTEVLRMAYIDSYVDREVYKYLTAKSRIGAQKPFATIKKMFEVLQKTYDDINWQHIAMNKFRGLKVTKGFDSFWAEFQVLISELDHNKATFISELKFKLTPSLFQIMADGLFWLTDIYEYAKQYQQMYQDLKDIEI